MYVCMYVCIYVCVYIYVCVCVCISFFLIAFCHNRSCPHSGTGSLLPFAHRARQDGDQSPWLAVCCHAKVGLHLTFDAQAVFLSYSTGNYYMQYFYNIIDYLSKIKL